MSWANHHNHCRYCDGVQTPEEHIRAAIDQDVRSLSFTSHSPLPFDTTWSMDLEDLPAYLREIDTLKSRFSGTIEIYKSLEIDYIPDVIGPSSEYIRTAGLDFTLGSVHFIPLAGGEGYLEIDGNTTIFKKHLKDQYQNDIRAVVQTYLQHTRDMVRHDCPDVIGHLDKIKIQNRHNTLWKETEEWYRSAILETLEEIRDSGAIVEVNTRGLYKKVAEEPYPSLWILKHIQDLGIKICLNSDAHHPWEITKKFRETAQMLHAIGIRYLMVHWQNRWQAMPFDAHGIAFNRAENTSV